MKVLIVMGGLLFKRASRRDGRVEQTLITHTNEREREGRENGCGGKESMCVSE